MVDVWKERLYRLLRWSERYTKTDMVYLAHSGMWTSAGTVFVTFASFLLYVLFGHVLSKEIYGTYQYLLSLSAIIGAFTLTGMNSAVARAIARGETGALAPAMRAQLRWNIVPLLIAWAMAAYYLWMGNAVLGWGLLLIGAFTPLNNALNTYSAVLLGRKDFKRGFLFSLWWNVPYYSAVAVAALFSRTALLLLAANLISQCAGLIVAYRATNQAYPQAGPAQPEAIEYGAHLSLMGFFVNAAAQVDSVLAFHFLGPAQLAIYSFSTAIPDRIATLFKFIPSAALPKFSGRRPGEIRVGLGRRLWWGTLATTLAGAAYMLAAKYIFVLFFPAYEAAVPFSQLYALTLLFSMSTVLLSALTAVADVRMLYVFNTANPFLQVALQVIGVLGWGLWGLIGARVLASGVAFLLGLVLLNLARDSAPALEDLGDRA